MNKERKITIIEPVRQKIEITATEIPEKLRVAAYARVSTEQDEQQSSYEAQVDFYTHYIQSNPNWEFVAVFADEGITGTNTRKRDGFNLMIQKAMNGEIDLILTKSISRFARNTVDTLQTVRKLKAAGVEVIFEKENLHTLDPKSEVKQGRFNKKNHEVNEILVDPDEAAVVRIIFEKYVYEGFGAQRLSRWLYNNGYLNRKGTNFANTTIIKMLKNILYVGILRSGETRSEIFPELQIVPLDLYERAQELMEARTMHHNEVPFNSKGKALLSGMVYCAHCGSKLVLTTSSGRRAKGEPKRETHIRYACHYKIRHPQDCDGQTGYSGEKLDGIIDKIVIQLFERMKTAPRSQLIQKQREKELQLANSSVANLEKLHASAERELESYKKEIIKTINGTGSFGADILGEMIEDTRSKLAALAQELEQAKEKAADLKNSAVAVQKEYDKIMSWADLYAGSSIEGKKMILRQLIERVNIGKNFEIEVEFKISVDKSVYYRAS